MSLKTVHLFAGFLFVCFSLFETAFYSVALGGLGTEWLAILLLQSRVLGWLLDYLNTLLF